MLGVSMRLQKLALLGVAVLVFGCASAPPASAPMAEKPKAEAPKAEAPKAVAEAPKVEAPKVVAPKVEAPKVVAPKPEAPKPPAPKPAVPVAAIPMKWVATGVTVTNNGKPFALPKSFVSSPVYATLGKSTLVLEVPSVAFRIEAGYELRSDGTVKITPTKYVNVPAEILQVAKLAEKEIGGKLPASFYFSVRQSGSTGYVEAKGLSFTLSSSWIPAR